MSMTTRLNGKDYVNWKSGNVFRSMESVSSAFSFRSSADKDNVFPIKRGDAVEIAIDDIQVMSGFVEKINPDYTYDTHDIVIAGRDTLGDFIDSTVGTIKEFEGSVGLDKIARTVLDGINLQQVKVLIADGLTINPFDAFDITSSDVGQKCFDFIESYARKRQVLVTTDGLGNLLLTRASTDVLPVILRNKVGGNDNNILGGSPSYDDSQRYNLYIARSQLNFFNLDSGTSPEEGTNQQGQAIDPEIRTSRILEFNQEESSDSQTSTQRAQWEANIRRARSLSYPVSVHGFNVSENSLWEPNKLVEVDDDFADIQSKMLIRSVRYSQGLESGSITTLDMTYSNAYTLEVEQASRDSVGEGLVL